jgi:hypothetical protein
MKKTISCSLIVVVAFLLPSVSSAQKTLVVRPVEINDVLVNPGMGFMTSNRFNGDDSHDENADWRQASPIKYKKFDGKLDNKDYPVDMPLGDYDIQVGIVDGKSCEPRVALAIKGRESDGWYTMGRIEVVR